MIHYHGGPITPESAAVAIWKGRHAFVSFAHPGQMNIAAEVCQSFALDNGAFSLWKAKKAVNWEKYYKFVSDWMRHPRFDFAVIPDTIDGSDLDNDILLSEWPFSKIVGVPVYHLHEPISRCVALASEYPRVALGSSGDFGVPGTIKWRSRMEEIMDAIVTSSGYPITKVHGLRMLNTKIFTKYPFSSADSTNIARNIGIDKKWKGTYQPATKTARGLVMADRIESCISAHRWSVHQAECRVFGGRASDCGWCEEKCLCEEA